MLGHLREVAENINSTGGPLDSEVEADETHLGGKERNKHASRCKYEGPDLVAKHPFHGAWARRDEVRMEAVPGTSRQTHKGFLNKHFAVDSHLYTDGHRGYIRLGYAHQAVEHSIGENVRGQVYANGIESFRALLKWGISEFFTSSLGSTCIAT